MSWVCKYCSTNNEDGDSKCMVCDREKRETRVCSLTAARVAALGLTGHITIPAEYNVIGEGAFKNRNDINTVTLHSEVTKIGKEAFSGCSNLTNVSCPVTLASVGVRAFYNCHRLPVWGRPKSRYTADDAYSSGAAYTASSSTSSYTPPRSYTAASSSYTPPRFSKGERLKKFGKVLKKVLHIALWGILILASLLSFIALLQMFI